MNYAAFGPTAGGLIAANANKITTAFADALRPPPRIGVAEWAERHRRFADDAPIPGPWRHETAPYLVEIMEALSPHHPAREVCLIKCAQSGGSAAAENFVGYVADVAPGPMGYVSPNVGAAENWARDKLWPMIRATPRLGGRDGAVLPRVKSDGDGSTKLRVQFARGGAVLLAGSNSAQTLSGHTWRYAVEDDLDRFNDDVEGQGSPEVMIDARLRVYSSQGLSKRFKISTPTIKGASKIGAAYEASDQRRYYLRCPVCASRFDPVWEDLRWPEGRTHEAHLVAPCCGGVIEHWQKAGCSTADGWAPTIDASAARAARVMEEGAFQAQRSADVGDRQPGFHLTGLVSAFLSWSDLAAKFVAAQGDVSKLKAWTNLELGELFEIKGSAPDHERLAQLKEQDWGAGEAPNGPLAFTLGVDVQGDGLFYELVGWAPMDESWSIAAGFLPGSTDIPGEGAWAQLEELSARELIMPGGRRQGIDQVCVDAGYHTPSAEAFCKRRANRLAVFGRAGWHRPILGRGESLRFETRGKRAGLASRRPDDKAYIVGTFNAKLTLYGYLRRTLETAEEEARIGHALEGVRGRCHFGRDAPADYFDQLTAETVAVKVINGHTRREWAVLPGRQNHYLDCRVYNLAAAEKLKLALMSADDWARLRAERASSPDQPDLIDLAVRPAAPSTGRASAAAADEAAWVDPGERWV